MTDTLEPISPNVNAYPKQELVSLLPRRLIQRRDVKAVQRGDGAYNPIRTPWTKTDLEKHLEGEVTYGHYIVDANDHCRLLAFDIDFDKEVSWTAPNGTVHELSPREIFGTDHPARDYLNSYIRGMADGLAWRMKRMYPNMVVLTAFSGSKGIHVYGCFGQATTAKAAREVAVTVLSSFGCFEPVRGKNFWKHVDQYESLTIEVFPKQEKVQSGKRLGNLLRLPMGINQKTGRGGFFYSVEAPQTLITPDDPVAALTLGSIRRSGL